MALFDDLTFFILTYNRDAVVPTLEVLHKYNIFDNVYLVVGKDDPKLNEIVARYKDLVLIFDKATVQHDVDSIGSYRNTLKLCTYARVFVDKYAMCNGLRYICILFDDIHSLQLRYEDCGKIKSSKNFDLKSLLCQYIDLLNSNQNVYMVGPPSSSFYIGCNVDTLNKIATHYGNMIIYDTKKPLIRYKASVLEDMTIVLYNSMIGHIGLFPFGLQVNCRKAGVTSDAYMNISKHEYVQQWQIMTRTFNNDKLVIPYSKFIPKIVSDKYRK